ncbi:hypothetical protein ACFC00_22410 [Streptomyces adustus]
MDQYPSSPSSVQLPGPDATQWLRTVGFAKVEARHLIGGYTAVYATK